MPSRGVDMEMETVSLNDDMPTSPTHTSQLDLDLDALDAPVPAPAPAPSASKVVRIGSQFPTPIREDDEEDEDNDSHVEVAIDPSVPEKPKAKPAPPTLPPLRVVKVMRPSEDDGDYVDPSLFSPELSRHAMEQAMRRAKNLEQELIEESVLEHETSPTSSRKFTAGEAISVISGAFVSSLSRVKHMVGQDDPEYDLLNNSSPSNKTDDLDPDGDGLQLSPDGAKADNKHFASPSMKPALKAISAYAGIETKQPQPRARKQIQWHEEVLDQDEEFVDDDDQLGADDESEAFMVNGGKSALAERQPTPRPPLRKKRKKIMRSMIHRLSSHEKEELYRQRPDLMIVPNWAQKYREEMSGHDSTRWTFGLIASVGTLVLLLVVLVILIAKDKQAAASL